MIVDTTYNRVLLSHHDHKLIVKLELIKPHFLEISIFWRPRNLPLAEMAQVYAPCCRPADWLTGPEPFPGTLHYLPGPISSSTGQMCSCEWHRRTALTQMWTPCQHSLLFMSSTYVGIVQPERRAALVHQTPHRQSWNNTSFLLSSIWAQRCRSGIRDDLAERWLRTFLRYQ